MTDHMPARDTLPTRTPGSTFTHKWTPPTPPPGPTCDCPAGHPIPVKEQQ